MLDFLRRLREASVARAEAWHSGEKWSLADWGNALAGETGELCNVIKKIRRIETGAVTRETEADMADLKKQAALEIADVIIYADLIANELGVDLEDIIKEKFNATSEKFGFEERV